MSEPVKEPEPVKVVDHRRFDRDGNRRADDEVQEPEVAPPAPPPPDPEVERLRAELEAARKRVDELARAFQALDRDREDFKARLSRERERLIEVEKGQVATTLLEAIDELELALFASPEQTPLAKGVRLIRDALLKKALASGIERLDLVGQQYDPELAEAVDMEVTANPEDDQKVISEQRAGYRLKDRVIRPARVRISRYVKPADA